MFYDWHFWTSVVTAAVALITLIQAKRQVKLSNKQHLFDKRMENYIIAIGLIELYRTNSNCLDDEKDEPMLAIDIDFAWLTNNTYLHNITPAIKSPLSEPIHKELLIKLEDLKEVNTKIRFLFSGKEAGLLGDFIFSYQELLFEMYRYKIIIDYMEKENEKCPLTLEEAQQKFGEKEYRIKFKEAFDKLKQAYNMLESEKVEEKIKKQISLQ